MSRLFLLRHGQSEANVDKSAYDRTPDHAIELTTPIGKNQIVQSATKFCDLVNREGVYRMFYSPYKRAIQTKNIFNGIVNLEFPLFGGVISEHENPLLREREWGDLRADVNEGNKTEDHFNFFYRPLKGESFADLYQRVTVFDTWLKSQNYEEDIIIVSHGELIKVYLMYLFDWKISMFETYRTPQNGNIYMITDGRLSRQTPLRMKEALE